MRPEHKSLREFTYTRTRTRASVLQNFHFQTNWIDFLFPPMALSLLWRLPTQLLLLRLLLRLGDAFFVLYMLLARQQQARLDVCVYTCR